MKLRLVPARQGALWVRHGFTVFFQRPLAYSVLFLAFLLFGLFALLLPIVGAVVVLAAMPLVSLGFMLATQRALQGRTPWPAVFIEPLKVDRRRGLALLRMGLAYAIATFAIMTLSDLVDGGKLEALQDAIGRGAEDSAAIGSLLGDPQLQIGLLLRVSLASLLSLPFWHAPALVHWGDQGVIKALFFSSVACWRNLAAFSVYGLAWGGVILLFGVLANLLAALTQQPQIVALATVPAGLLISTVFYASLYFSFADCFAPDTAADSAPD